MSKIGCLIFGLCKYKSLLLISAHFFVKTVEYYLWSIRDFMAQDTSWAPYFAAGLHWVGFDPYAYSDFGNLNTPITTPDKYYYGFQQSGGSTWSIVTSAGTRYKISKSVDFLMDWRWQY